MKPKLIAIATLCLLFSIHLLAQKKKKSGIANRVVCTYGDVKPEDFNPTIYSIDSSAEAVYLFNGGNALITASKHAGWDVVRAVHVRMRILKKPAFDLATVKIRMYVTNTFQQEISDIKATTYNLSNGSVVATELNKKDIYQEKLTDKFQAVKFTLPNITKGSIIEYSYTLLTPGANHLSGWEFQKRYPVLWSEYQINYPSIFDYVLLKKGYQPYVIDTATLKSSSYLYHQSLDGGIGLTDQALTISCQAINYVWAMKDVPALKEEPFTTTLDNHIAQIDFQLSTIRYSEEDVVHYLRSWEGVTDTITKRDYYLGTAFSPSPGFLNDDARQAAAGETDELASAKKIYSWVRDNYTSTKTYPWIEQTLRKVYQSKKGNSAEINSILMIMLKDAGINAYPVLLSTTDNGRATISYPLLDQYNDVICLAKIGGKQYLLDASDGKLGFNKLDADCYNGYARVIDPSDPMAIDISADSLKEREYTSVFMMNDKDKLTGEVSNTKGYEESLSLRKELMKTSKEFFFKNIKTGYTDNVEVTGETIDSLQKFDEPLRIGYHLTMDNNGEDVLYFNPMMANRRKDNPFAAAERYYPVEMPYCKEETYVLNMEIPKGYDVDELPKSARVKLNENEGMFEYIIAKSNDHVQLRTVLKLNKATYEPDDYQTLRDFFAFIVKKEEEQIVFKKK